MNELLIFACAVGAFAGALLLTRLAIHIAHALDVIDHPNHRSSHQHPTPRLGGVAIALAASATLLLWGVFGLPGSRQLTAILAGCAALGTIGVIDDFRSARASLRLAVQALVVGGIVLFYFPLATTPWLWVAVALLAAIWFVNLFNFMDGLDGFASSEAIFVLGFTGVVGLRAGDPLIAGTSLITAAAVGGFLPWNWSPAKTFLGDGGSYWVGAFLMATLVAGLARGVLPLSVVLILPAPFVADATICILRRTIRRERIWVGHRLHAYQRAADRLGGARPVVLGVIMLNLAVVLPCAVLALAAPALQWVVVGSAYAVLTTIALGFGSGARSIVTDGDAMAILPRGR